MDINKLKRWPENPRPKNTPNKSPSNSNVIPKTSKLFNFRSSNPNSWQFHLRQQIAYKRSAKEQLFRPRNDPPR
jgi:hypothetical protein